MEEKKETLSIEGVTLEKRKTRRKEIKTIITEKNKHGFYQITGYIIKIVFLPEEQEVILMWDDGVIKRAVVSANITELKAGNATLFCRASRIDKIVWD